MLAEAEVNETAQATVQPLTGAEYLDSLKDDREIWIYGERVKDVTTHPAFAIRCAWLPGCTMLCMIPKPKMLC